MPEANVDHIYDYDPQYLADILNSVKTIAMVGASAKWLSYNASLEDLGNPAGFSSLGNGWGFDAGAHVLLFKKLHLAASVTNIGKMTYTGNVYEVEDTLMVNFSSDGMEDMNITNSVPQMLQESGLLKVKGKESYTVALPGTFRMGASIELGKIAHIGMDMVAPFNAVPGSFNGFAWGLGGDLKLAKGAITIMTGVTGGGGYDVQVPVGINFALKGGAYEFGFASRDAVTFFKDNSPTLSMAMGFARVRF